MELYHPSKDGVFGHCHDPALKIMGEDMLYISDQTGGAPVFAMISNLQFKKWYRGYQNMGTVHHSTFGEYGT
tara:strand:- start:312 stop:527 length:216 start_codon:yes stop_codon:yes gene_type:complete